MSREKAEAILDAKESYNFLSMSEKERVIIAMQEYHRRQTRRLREKVEEERGSLGASEFAEGFDQGMRHTINLIDNME